jgi:hypothetical protein
MKEPDTPDRIEEEVRATLEALLAQAARLREELELDGVEPAPPVPDWR